MSKRSCAKPGEWICARCKGANLTLRRQCKHCGARRPDPIKPQQVRLP